MMWVVIVLSLLAACGVAIGILRKRAEKLGLPQISRWKKNWVPITLVVDEEDFLPEEVARVRGAIRKAARFWNEQTGTTLFALLDEVGTGGP